MIWLVAIGAVWVAYVALKQHARRRDELERLRAAYLAGYQQGAQDLADRLNQGEVPSIEVVMN